MANKLVSKTIPVNSPNCKRTLFCFFRIFGLCRQRKSPEDQHRQDREDGDEKSKSCRNITKSPILLFIDSCFILDGANVGDPSQSRPQTPNNRPCFHSFSSICKRAGRLS